MCKFGALGTWIDGGMVGGDGTGQVCGVEKGTGYQEGVRHAR
jgi:hypothetical protein